MRKLLLLRPEPGLSASAGRARRLGLDVIGCPIFRIEPVQWEVPDPKSYDGLLLTSANAVRDAGPGLDALMELPAHAVGGTTAEAARDAGLNVETVGDRDIISLLAKLPNDIRLLHLAGEDHRDPGDDRIDRRIVYRSAAVQDPPLPEMNGLVVAVHSPRAGSRLAELAKQRGKTAIAAISEAAAKACGDGWERVESAEKPADKCLLALAARLCHTSIPE